jgi:hypothetical protein
MDHTWVAVRDIKVERRRMRDLGDLKPLAASIKNYGFFDPLIVAHDGTLISGWRRLSAAPENMKQLPAYVATSAPEAIDRMDKEGQNPDHYKEMTWTERAALGMDLEKLDVIRRERMTVERAKRAIASRYGTDVPYDENLVGQPPLNQLIGGFFGVSAMTYYRVRAVFLAYRGTSEEKAGFDPEWLARGKAAYKDLEVFGAPARSYAILRGERMPVEAVDVTPASRPATVQTELLGRVNQALHGILAPLDQLAVLSPDITQKEAARWASDLSRHRLQLEKLIKRLKGHDSE